MATPLLILLRLLFPSWEFFDVARQAPALEVLAHPEIGKTEVWERVVYPPARRWLHLLFNPGGTRTLAVQTIVERCYAELISEESDPVARQEAIALVDALAHSWVRHADTGQHPTRPTTRHGDIDKPATRRWRIIVRDDETGATAFVFVNDVHTMSTPAPHMGAAT